MDQIHSVYLLVKLKNELFASKSTKCKYVSNSEKKKKKKRNNFLKNKKQHNCFQISELELFLKDIND